MTLPTRAVRLALTVLAAGLAVPAARAQAPDALRVADAADATRLRLDVRGGLVVSGTAVDPPNPATIPTTGAGTRLMFWPEQGAFRVGTVVGPEWDAANVGGWSFAAGYETWASAPYATAFGEGSVAAGSGSTAMGRSTRASGLNATAMGRQTTASGVYSTAMGYLTTASGTASTAMGNSASTNGLSGAFVVGDNSTGNPLIASAPNQFSARFASGYRLFTTDNMTVGAQLPAGATSWSTLSDSTRKAGFQPYDPAAVLDGLARLRLGTWHYRGQDPATQRHWGPMAQDFYREFGRDGVGTVGSDTLIATGDADGVLFAAAQALDARTRDLDARIVALEAERRRERTGALAAVGLFGLGFLGFAVRRRPSAL